MSYLKLFAILPCAACCAALPATAAAQEQSGMVVVRDAQSGQLRTPTAAEIRALAPTPGAAALQAPSQPALEIHPSGARQVRLGERGLVYSVVTRGADGKLHDQCVQGAAAADQAVHAPAPAQHKEEDRHE
jgi:hypothetical protein